MSTTGLLVVLLRFAVFVGVEAIFVVVVVLIVVLLLVVAVVDWC